MGRIFQRKQFSDYLGENRAILDIITSYTPEQCSQFNLQYSAYPVLDGIYTQISGEKVTILDIISIPSFPENGQFFKKNGEDTYLFFNEPGFIFQFYTGVTNTNIGSNLTSNKVPFPNSVNYDNGIYLSVNKTYPRAGQSIPSGVTGETTDIIYFNCPYVVSPTPTPTSGLTPTPTPTPTITPTITNTPSVTPTLTPSPTTPSNLFFVDSGFDTTTECILNDDSNDAIFVGGVFNFWQGNYSPHIVKIDKYGTIDPTFVSGLDPASTSIRVSCIAQSSVDNEIYIGGDFTSYSGVTTQRFTKIDKTTGQQISGWNGTNAQNGVTNMVVDGSDVVIIGAFTSYGGTSRARIARITSGNTVDTTIFSGTPFTTAPHKIIKNNAGNYVVVGQYTSYYGATINGIVEIDRNTGLNTGLFGSGFNGGVARDITYDSVNDIYYVITQGAANSYQGSATGWLYAIDGTGSLISVASPFTVSQPPLGIFGDFTNGYLYITWNALNRYSRVDVATLTQDTSWYSNIGVVNGASFQPGRVFAALNTDDKVYLTGQFTSFFGQNYNRIVRLNQDGTTNSYL